MTGEASLALLFRHLSASRLITIAQIEGRVRGAGSEFVLACDMRFAAVESAIFGQIEAALGVMPGAAAAQHLPRLMGRGRALEVMLSAQDYDATVGERYGWINRTLPANELGEFVTSLAHRIASFPAAGLVTIKERVNAIALAAVDELRRDSAYELPNPMSTEKIDLLTNTALNCGCVHRGGACRVLKCESNATVNRDLFR